MKNLDLNRYGIQEMDKVETTNINGGNWVVAGICFLVEAGITAVTGKDVMGHTADGMRAVYKYNVEHNSFPPHLTR